MQKKVRGKKYVAAQKLVDAKKLYAPAEAMELAKKTATTKFDSSIEVHMHLGIDPKKGEQAVRGVVVMPHATGQTKRVAVFTVAHADAATKAGADLVGGKELIAEIKSSGKCDFDIAVADPSMMKEIAVIAKVLGPKGLMPSPKNETVTNKIEQTVMELKRGKVTFKNDDSANVHQSVGKASLDAQKLAENLIAFIDAVKKAKPASAKGSYIENIVVCSTMGPGIKVSI